MSDEEGDQDDRYPNVDHRVMAKDLRPVNEVRYWLCPNLGSVVTGETHEGTGKYKSFCGGFSTFFTVHVPLYL